MSIHELKTGYAPKTEPIKDLQLPVELKNPQGTVLASISRHERDGRYHWFINGINNPGDYGYEDFTDCLQDCFGQLYQTMQEYRKETEKYGRLRAALTETLKTPFNKL